MTPSAAPSGIRNRVRCTTVQPISIGQGSVARPELARSEDQNTRNLGRDRIGICCGHSQGLRYYADQYIQWPNSSSASLALYR